jgi:hypothetical protein
MVLNLKVVTAAVVFVAVEAETGLAVNCYLVVAPNSKGKCSEYFLVRTSLPMATGME